MSVKTQIARLLPPTVRSAIKTQLEKRELAQLPKQVCREAPLVPIAAVNLGAILSAEADKIGWTTTAKSFTPFAIPDGTGGVNPGDRRALYYLLSHFKPSSVLEVGTHIGASTVHIAAALHQMHDQPELITVDIADVNDPVSKPWLNYGTKLSPIEMLKALDFDSFVTFVASPALEFMANCGRKFDFIFLDGDHSAAAVYQEIPAALNLLNEGGVILLHDYYPDLRPLWAVDNVIQGPYLAAERYREEGANLTVYPLGNLPWETKLQSNVTSLALLLRKR